MYKSVSLACLQKYINSGIHTKDFLPFEKKSDHTIHLLRIFSIFAIERIYNTFSPNDNSIRL